MLAYLSDSILEIDCDGHPLHLFLLRTIGLKKQFLTVILKKVSILNMF